MSFGGKTIEAEDFDVKFEREGAETSDFTNAGTITVVISGKRNFTGTKTVTYDIAKASIDDINVTLEYSQITFTGQPLKPGITQITFKNKKITKEEIEVEFSKSFGQNTNVIDGGIVYITSKGKNFVADSQKEVKFTILAKSIKDLEIAEISNKLFNGEVQYADINMSYNDYSLKLDTDFEVTYYSDNTKWTEATPQARGTYYLKINGIKNFKGEIADKTFTISESAISDKNLRIEWIDSDDTTLAPTFDFNFEEQCPTVNVFMSVEGQPEVKLESNKDYTITFKNNINATTDAKVIIKGKGNYTGQAEYTFAINAVKVSNVTFSNYKESYDYTSEEIKPIILGNYLGHELTDADFEVQFNGDDYINVGEKVIKIIGKGNFVGETEIKYSINQISITSVAIDPQQAYFDNISRKDNITITVYAGTIKLESGDFDISYDDNDSWKNAGEHIITITGKGNFKDEKQAIFNILRKNLSDAEIVVEGIETKVYQDGEAITQENLVVKYNVSETNTIILVQGDESQVGDFYVNYINNINAGTATIEIIPTENGNYEGKKIITFTIDKKQPTVILPNLTQYTYFTGVELSTVTQFVLQEGSTPGTLSFRDVQKPITDGRNSYEWTFVPNDTTNYEGKTGTIEIIGTPVAVIETEVVNSDLSPFSFECLAYTKFVTDDIYVKATYNNGDVKVIPQNKYRFTKNGLELTEENNILRVGDVLRVYADEYWSGGKDISVVINPRVLTVTFFDRLIIESIEEQFLNSDPANPDFEVSGMFEDYDPEIYVEYSLNGEVKPSILLSGTYRVKILARNNNYTFETGTNEKDIIVKLGVIQSEDGKVVISNTAGFEAGTIVEIKEIEDRNEQKQYAGNFEHSIERLLIITIKDKDGNIVQVDSNVTIRILTERRLLENTNLKVYNKQDESSRIMPINFEIDGEYLVLTTDKFGVFILATPTVEISWWIYIVVGAVVVFVVAIIFIMRAVRQRARRKIASQTINKL